MVDEKKIHRHCTIEKLAQHLHTALSVSGKHTRIHGPRMINWPCWTRQNDIIAREDNALYARVNEMYGMLLTHSLNQSQLITTSHETIQSDIQKMTLDVVRTQATVQAEFSSLSKLANDHHEALSRQVLQIRRRTAGLMKALRMDHGVLYVRVNTRTSSAGTWQREGRLPSSDVRTVP